jgi:ATP-dependent helicase/nuclease subunit A
MRSRAATDFSKNFIVLAGAGTGKTSLLVERMLVAIGAGTAALPRLAAITFTEKAAGEMHERLALGLSRLHARSTGEAAHADGEAADRAYRYLTDLGCAREEIAARTLAAFDALPSATITTIHGFCARILRAHPREAGLPPGFTVDALKEGDLVFDELWAGFLERELGPRGTRTEAWNAALPIFRWTRWRRSREGSPSPRSRRAAARDYVAADLRALFSAEAAEAAQQARAHGGTHSAALVEGCEALAADGFEGLRAFFDAHAGFETVLKKGDFPAPLKPARGLLRDLAPVDETGFAAAHALLAPFALEVRATRRARGIVSFDELLAATARLLRAHPEVRASLRERYRMLLVDEFQDTDPLQYEIVLLLSARGTGAAADAYQADLEPGRLFLVGDPKQSVYRSAGPTTPRCPRHRARAGLRRRDPAPGGELAQRGGGAGAGARRLPGAREHHLAGRGGIPARLPVPARRPGERRRRPARRGLVGARRPSRVLCPPRTGDGPRDGCWPGHRGRRARGALPPRATSPSSCAPS